MKKGYKTFLQSGRHGSSSMAAAEETAKGWIGETDFWWLQWGGRRWWKRPRGWAGVSFRGIDVSQYSPRCRWHPYLQRPRRNLCRRAKPRPENAPRRILFSLFRPLNALPDELESLQEEWKLWIRWSMSFSEVMKKKILDSCMMSLSYFIYGY